MAHNQRVTHEDGTVVEDFEDKTVTRQTDGTVIEVLKVVGADGVTKICTFSDDVVVKEFKDGPWLRRPTADSYDLLRAA